jgi:hypothetical protein
LSAQPVKLTRLIGRKKKEDGKEDDYELRNEILEHEAHEARACESDRLQHAAGSAGLCNPPSPSGGAGTTPPSNLQRSNQTGKLSLPRDPRVFP